MTESRARKKSALVRLVLTAVVAAGLASIWAPPAEAGSATTAYSVKSDVDDQLYRVNLQTGASTAIGATGFGDLEGLALSPDGTLFAVDDTTDVLVTINTTTGAATSVGALGIAVNDLGLTFDCAGNLFMSTDAPSPEKLYKLNPATGAATEVGDQGQDVTGLTARGSTVYGLGGDSTNNLVTMNTTTGAATAVGALGASLAISDGGLDFDDNGVLWGLSDTGPTFTINTSTGAATAVSDAGGGFEGLAISVPGGCASVANVNVNEGASATFTVSLTPTSGPVTVTYATANGTATAGSDYTAANGTVTYATGETSKNVSVPVTADCATEANETFTLNLSAPTGGGAIVTASATATITSINCVGMADAAVPEGNSGVNNATFNVTVSAAQATPVTVQFATANGTATAGSDYMASNGTVSFAANETSKTITIPILGDTQVEPNETILVNFSTPTGALLVDNQAVVTIIDDDAGSGYWEVASDGGIFAFGVPFYGSTGNIKLNRPVVGMAPTPTGNGYWLVASDGGIFNFGDAGFFGSTGAIRLNQPIVGMTATPSGKGYWLVASDGGIFAFGDAVFKGSTGAIRLNQPIRGMAATPSGNGYWLVATDGGIFAFGDAVFKGSTGAIRLNQPIVGMAATKSGNGYWLSASDGGIFAFGDAVFKGSTGAIRLNQPMVGMAAR